MSDTRERAIEQRTGRRMLRPRLHIISQAHIDPVWLWPWRDGFAEVLTTLQSAVDRLHEFPEMRYTCSSAAFYRWVKRTDPRLFGEIRELVRANRWETVGGWIIEADTLAPSDVSLQRQGRLGQSWLKENLGTTATIGYCVDSFGHSAGLPSLLAAEGLRRYVFQRPSPEENPDLPNLFRWQGPDGAEVLTWRLALGYGQPTGMTADDLESALRQKWRIAMADPFPVGTWFLGVGNHGGGPTREHVHRLVELQEADDPELPLLRFSTLEDFFGDLAGCTGFTGIPVVEGELLHHARGCYAANARFKRLHRRTERELVTAERLLGMRGASGDAAGRLSAGLDEAWRTLCFNEFHDILPGTSIPTAFEHSRDELGAARHAARTATVESVHAMARRIDTTGAPEGVLFVANPLPWDRSAIVTVDTFVAPHGQEITHLADTAGMTTPIQWSSGEAGFGPNHVGWKKLVACVPIAASGTKWFHLAHGQTPHGDDRRVGPSLTDVARRVSLVVVDDRADTWGHRVDRWDVETGRPSCAGEEVLDDGPLFRRTRRRYEYGRSVVLLDTVEWHPLEAVELVLHVTWQEHYRALKLELPLDPGSPRLYARTPGAVVRRPLDGNEWFWGDWLVAEDDGRRLVVAGDGCSSYDATPDRLRLTVLRCVPHAQHDPTPHPDESPAPFLDEGYERAAFWLAFGDATAVGTAGGGTAAVGDASSPSGWQPVERLVAGFLNPAEQMVDSAHPGAAVDGEGESDG